MPLGTGVGLGLGDIVLDGDPAPPRTGARTAQHFGPCLLWLNGWMNQDATLPLGTEVGLDPCHIVLKGDPAPHGKGHCSPNFTPCLLWPNGRPSQRPLSSLFHLCLATSMCV